MGEAKRWFTANGGIKNKQTREMVMQFDSEALKGTGLIYKIAKRGRVIIQYAPYKNGQPSTKAMELLGITMKERDRNELRDRRSKREKHASYRRINKVLAAIEEGKK